MAAKCEFGDQMNSHIMDAFIQNMNNKSAQERPYTEPKGNPQEASRFAVAYKEREFNNTIRMKGKYRKA